LTVKILSLFNFFAPETPILGNSVMDVLRLNIDLFLIKIPFISVLVKLRKKHIIRE